MQAPDCLGAGTHLAPPGALLLLSPPPARRSSSGCRKKVAWKRWSKNEVCAAQQQQRRRRQQRARQQRHPWYTPCCGGGMLPCCYEGPCCCWHCRHVSPASHLDVNRVTLACLDGTLALRVRRRQPQRDRRVQRLAGQQPEARGADAVAVAGTRPNVALNRRAQAVGDAHRLRRRLRSSSSRQQERLHVSVADWSGACCMHTRLCIATRGWASSAPATAGESHHWGCSQAVPCMPAHHRNAPFQIGHRGTPVLL